MGIVLFFSLLLHSGNRSRHWPAHDVLLVEAWHQASDHQRIDLADIANVDGIGELDVFEKHPVMRLRRTHGSFPTFDTKLSMLSGCR